MTPGGMAPGVSAKPLEGKRQRLCGWHKRRNGLRIRYARVTVRHGSEWIESTARLDERRVLIKDKETRL